MTRPAFVIPDTSVEILDRLPRVHKEFSELFLQDLLAKNPEILPIGDVRDEVGSLLCVGREVSVGSAGTIDNLYISTSGYPVIVETKLWRNPQARREVLSQTLDYIKEIATKDYEWFVEQHKRFNEKSRSGSDDMIRRLNELSVDELDEGEIVDRLNRCLSQGDIIAMIVGDGIETRLQKLVAHLCKDSAHLRYSLVLVELAFYRFQQEKNKGFLVIPRIVQDVEPVERAYVRIELADPGLRHQLKVTPAVTEERPSRKTSRRIKLSEDDFLRVVEQSAGQECRVAIHEFYIDLVDAFELETHFMSSALMLKVPHPDGDLPSTSLLGLGKEGRVYNTEHMRGQLKRWISDEKLVDQITTDYWDALHKLDQRFALNGMSHVAPNLFIPFPDLVENLKSIKDLVGETAARIRSSIDDGV